MSTATDIYAALPNTHGPYRHIDGVTPEDLEWVEKWARDVSERADTTGEPWHSRSAEPPWMVLLRPDDGKPFGLSAVFVGNRGQVLLIADATGGGRAGSGMVEVARDVKGFERAGYPMNGTDRDEAFDAVMRIVQVFDFFTGQRAAHRELVHDEPDRRRPVKNWEAERLGMTHNEYLAYQRGLRDALEKNPEHRDWEPPRKAFPSPQTAQEALDLIAAMIDGTDMRNLEFRAGVAAALDAILHMDGINGEEFIRRHEDNPPMAEFH